MVQSDFYVCEFTVIMPPQNIGTKIELNRKKKIFQFLAEDLGNINATNETFF